MLAFIEIMAGLHLLFSIAAIHPRMRFPLRMSQPENMRIFGIQEEKGNSLVEDFGNPNIKSRFPFIRIHSSEEIFTPNATQIAEDSFAWIVNEMRQFIRETYFDAVRFEDSFPGIQKVIDELEEKAKVILIRNSVLSDHLRFVKSLFQTMKTSAITLNNLKANENKEALLIYEIIDANIRLWSLFDNYGKPDKTALGYGQKVFGFAKQIICWQKKFEFFNTNAQMRMQVIFKDLIKEAEEKISQLSRHMVLGEFLAALATMQCDWE